MTVESLERHSWNEQLVTFVDRYSAGRAAQAISHDDLPDLGAVVVLPTWTWGPARINVGAKDRGPNGEKLALPVPVTWQPSPVLVVPTGQQVEVACSIVGLGYTGRSSATVCAVPGIVSTETTMRTEGLPVPARVRQPVTTRRRIASRLDELVADGHHAYWQIIQLLEPTLSAALLRAVKHVSAEAYEGDDSRAGRALDEADMEAIRTNMLLGTEERTGVIPRLIEKVASPAGRFAKVDPQRFIVTAIDRDAKAAVRQAVGDPHIGPKVRAVAKELGTEDLDVLLPVYRERYPADNLSVTRARAALDLRRRPSASHFSILDTDVPEQSFEDSVAERIDKARRLAELARRRHARGAHIGRRGADSDKGRGAAGKSGRLRYRTDTDDDLLDGRSA